MSREWSARDTAYFLPLLIERAGKTCFYCKYDVYLAEEINRNPHSTRERQLAAARRIRKATVDHKVPVSKGGAEFDIENMVVACDKCNQQKKDRFPNHFKKKKRQSGRR